MFSTLAAPPFQVWRRSRSSTLRLPLMGPRTSTSAGSDCAASATSIAVIPVPMAGICSSKNVSPTSGRTHLHVVTIDDPQWGAYLRFRDTLRANANLRDRYAALKQALAAQFPEDRVGYTNGKASFIRHVLDR